MGSNSTFFYVVEFKNHCRIVGFADFDGTNMTVRKSRSAPLEEYLKDNFPGLELKNKHEWVGFRPITPDQNPYIGKMKNYSNVFINSGQGNIGFSCSLASASLLAEQMAKNPLKLPSTS